MGHPAALCRTAHAVMKDPKPCTSSVRRPAGVLRHPPLVLVACNVPADRDRGRMPRLRLGRSYWLDAHPTRAPSFAALRSDRVADVAVVGGGVTGCSAALLFARAGARVVLVDAHRIGRGSTAASTALLMQEPDTD